jgi:predicted CoA-binding protein
MAYGLKSGEISGVTIETDQHFFLDKNIHTVTLYVGAQRQGPLVDWIMQLAPKRVIFNPGTENPTFERQLREAGVEVLEACTLVMLSTRQY